MLFHLDLLSEFTELLKQFKKIKIYFKAENLFRKIYRSGHILAVLRVIITALFKNIFQFRAYLPKSLNIVPFFNICWPFLPFFWKIARMHLRFRIGPSGTNVQQLIHVKQNIVFTVRIRHLQIIKVSKK